MGFFSSLFGTEPDLEKLSAYEMNRYVTSLNRWIEKNSIHHDISSTPSDSVKEKIRKKKEQVNRALVVWNRKNKEAKLQKS